MGCKVHRLKSSYNDVRTAAVGDFSQLDPGTKTLMEKYMNCKWDYVEK